MSIAVVEKTFQVLEALVRFGEAVPLVRVSAEAELPKPTAYRILQSLAGLGYVAQEEGTGHYFATDRLAGLASRDPFLTLKQLALPMMEQLHTRFDETVNLGVLRGQKVVYAQVLETTRDLRWVVRPGRSDYFYCTALGRAIVAFLPEKQGESLLVKTKFERVGAKTVTDRKKLAAILDEARRRGWAAEEEEAAGGVACMAFSLAGWGAPQAAISVSIPVSRFTRSLRAELADEFQRLLEAAP
jgi:DNA-binding IclR family transcriptional regulator